jgi:hypothetical protein
MQFLGTVSINILWISIYWAIERNPGIGIYIVDTYTTIDKRLEVNDLPQVHAYGDDSLFADNVNTVRNKKYFYA